MAMESKQRDLVVVGASAGGVQALSALVAGLPRDFSAATVVVMHLSASSPSILPSILQRTTSLEVVTAEDGKPLRPGVVYVAPPDHHTVVRDGHLILNRGPRENRHRPSIDALFRTAAAARGVNVVGVVMSGALDDGAIGLRLVERAGGATVVQDPEEAQFRSMPDSALRLVKAGHVALSTEIGALLGRLTSEPISDDVLARFKPAAPLSKATAASGFTCPDCGGSLSEVVDDDITRYECRIGHRYSPGTLDAASGDATEAALWAAVRALRESAAVDRRLVELASNGNAPGASRSYEANARDKDRHADQIETFLADALNSMRA